MERALDSSWAGAEGCHRRASPESSRERKKSTLKGRENNLAGNILPFACFRRGVSDLSVSQITPVSHSLPCMQLKGWLPGIPDTHEHQQADQEEKGDRSHAGTLAVEDIRDQAEYGWSHEGDRLAR